MRSRFVSTIRSHDLETQRLVVAFGVGALLLFVAGVFTFTLLTRDSGSSALPAVSKIEVSPLRRSSVLVPTQPIAINTRLSPAMFRSVVIDESLLPTGAITSPDQLTNRFAHTNLLANYPVVNEVIGEERSTASDLQVTIPPNYRAITIDVNRRTSFGGFLQPGDRVDVQWITHVSGRSMLYPLVSDAEVISAEKRLERSNRPEDISIITLLVPTRDANKITYALANGSLSLTLRGRNNQGDTGDNQPIDPSTIIPGSPGANARVVTP